MASVIGGFPPQQMMQQGGYGQQPMNPQMQQQMQQQHQMQQQRQQQMAQQNGYGGPMHQQQQQQPQQGGMQGYDQQQSDFIVVQGGQNYPGERVIEEQQHVPEVHATIVGPGPLGAGLEPIKAEKKQKEKKYKIGSGSDLKNFYVHKKKELNNNKDIWVCTVKDRAKRGASCINIQPGDEVLVPYDDIVFSSDDESDGDGGGDGDDGNVAPSEANLRIGSWNIRCTKQFQEPSMFFTGLIQRFARLSEVICNSKVNCDIVALQELPIQFTHPSGDIDLKADDILPELIDQLDKYSNMNGSNDKWGVAYSEDFPQNVWMDQRMKSEGRKLSNKYDMRNGLFIHAFVYKRNKITCHSVEQVLDLRLQESLFKHAPSLGRFTFMDRFHFSLCNVHMRPYKNPSENSFHEIKDLGECIPELSKYNPDSTILLGDWNMSAVPQAPESSTLPLARITEFKPYVPGVWLNMRERGYIPAIQNCYTNINNDKQYDNIWIPEALRDKMKCSHRDALKVERPTGKEEYSRTNNVVDLSRFFSGGTRTVTNAVTEHNLVHVDLEIDLTIERMLIKKVLEINISANDEVAESSQPDTNVDEGTSEKKKSVKKSLSGEVDGVDKSDKKKQGDTGRKSLSGEVGGDNEGGTGGGKKKQGEKSSPDGKSESDNPLFGNRLNAVKHFKIWNKTSDTSVTALGGKEGKNHWSMNLFPPDFNVKDSDVYRDMKRQEKEYFELFSKVETEELKKSKKTALKNFNKSVENEYRSYINNDDDDLPPELLPDANNSSTV